MPDAVLLTDHPWPEVDVERALIEAAGYRLIVGPQETPSGVTVEAMVGEHDPVAIMTCWACVSATAINLPARLRVVARMGVGLDNIDLAAATARGAWVVNVPDYCVEEVSDHAIALLLDLLRGITAMSGEVRAGRWEPGAAKLRRVADVTVGIIGYGRTGAATARKLAQGFGCRILVYSPSLLERWLQGHEVAPGVHVESIATIRRQADAIVLHAPLTPSSRHLVDDEFIAGLERRPVLINVSRGGLVDNEALLRGLKAGRIAAAGLDVVEGEPSPPPALLTRPEVIITPHIAFTSDAALLELRRRSAQDVLRVLQGQVPLHPCNEPRPALRASV
jgi:D-3-phosphoglycerate dehydrogenase / 2-oxoglutarate reductase